jgi:hypothetical protein
LVNLKGEYASLLLEKDPLVMHLFTSTICYLYFIDILRAPYFFLEYGGELWKF